MPVDGITYDDKLETLGVREPPTKAVVAPTFTNELPFQRKIVDPENPEQGTFGGLFLPPPRLAVI